MGSEMCIRDRDKPTYLKYLALNPRFIGKSYDSPKLVIPDIPVPLSIFDTPPPAVKIILSVSFAFILPMADIAEISSFESLPVKF